MKIFIFLTAAVLLAGPALAVKPAKNAPVQADAKQLTEEKTAASAPVQADTKQLTEEKTAASAPVQADAKQIAEEKTDKSAAEKEKPAETSAVAAAVPQTPAAAAAPEVSSAAEKAKAARPQSCPNCFLPLLTGYKNIIKELEPWMAEMETQANNLDQTLLTIQKQIDEKDDALEKAKLGTDKEAVKAAVKSLSRERKLLLKEYGAASDKKIAFYKQFSKEISKKTESCNKTALEKLKEAQAAAAQEY